MSSLLEQAKNSNKELEKKVDTVSVMVSTISDKIKSILPRNINSDRFIVSVINTIKKNKDLIKCDQSSLLGSILTAAQMGLELGGVLGQCYIIPYNGLAEFQLGYKGMITLSQRLGNLKDLYAYAVYENDVFSYKLGLHRDLVHEPATNDRGDIKGAYAVVRLDNGGMFFNYMSKNEILKRKFVSKSSKSESSPWSRWEDEMYCKTALKYVLSRSGLSAEFIELIMNDCVIKSYRDDRNDYQSIDEKDVINVDFEVKE